MKPPEICLGVTGSIAAYKSCELARLMVKSGYDVSVAMTSSATEFVRPLTFRSLTSRPVISDMFDEAEEHDTEHVAVAHRCAAIVVAPATANVVGKFARGIADDFLTTTVLAAECPVIVAPAMNQSMLANPVYRENEDELKKRGFIFVEPESGELACGEVGAGRMVDPSIIAGEVDAIVRVSKSLAGVKVLVTAGPTREFIDPVRFISNPSSGKMGFEIARAASLRGADVIMVSGPTNEISPYGVDCIRIKTAAEMNQAVMDRAGECTVFVGAAAVSDYTPGISAEQKIKKSDDPIEIVLERTEDVIANVAAEMVSGRILVGFAAETEHVIENARCKLDRKGLDMIVANRVTGPSGGFEDDMNSASILFADGRPDVDVPLTSKRVLAARIMDEVVGLRNWEGDVQT